MTIEEHYKAYSTDLSDVMQKSLRDNSEVFQMFAASHQILTDYEPWLRLLEGRPETNIYHNAIRCYQTALLNVVTGLYQPAFFGLRYFFEWTLMGIFFSANELELNTWLLGGRDTYWSELVGDENNDSGLFFNKFCKASFPEMKEEIRDFWGMSKKVYRECSEYVHGNPEAIGKLPEKLSYSEYLFIEWNRRADTIGYIIQYCFCLRYLKSLNVGAIKTLSPSLRENLKTIKSVNLFLDAYYD